MHQPNQFREVVSHERAAAVEQAAGDLGGITVRALAKEGEKYVHETPLILTSPSLRQLPERSVKDVVPEGHVYLETSLGQPHNSTDELHRRADELQEQQRADSKAA